VRLPSLPHVRSPFLRNVTTAGGEILWHSLLGNPTQATAETLDVLRCFETPSSPETIASALHLDALSREALDGLIRASFIVPTSTDERQLLQSRIDYSTDVATNGGRLDNLSLIVTDSCNFACKYCIHNRNLSDSLRLLSIQKWMKVDVATAAVDSFLQLASRNKRTVVEINFSGGEPLLNWRVVSTTLDYCRNRYGDRFNVEFSINTNASLITSPIARKLREHRVKVSTSLDGGQPANDSVRITRNRKGSFDSIVRGLDVLDRCEHPAQSLAVTIDDNNFDVLDDAVFIVANKFGIKNVRVDADVLGGTTRPVPEVIEKLQQLRRCGASFGIDVPGFWLRPAENLNETPITDDVAFCGAVRGNSVCVSPSGDLFACGYSGAPLGHISTFPDLCKPGTPYARLIRRRSVGQEPECHGCIVEGQCAGGCEITREYACREGKAVSRMCDLYRTMFLELLKEEVDNTMDDAKGGESWKSSKEEASRS